MPNLVLFGKPCLIWIGFGGEWFDADFVVKWILVSHRSSSTDTMSLSFSTGGKTSRARICHVQAKREGIPALQSFGRGGATATRCTRGADAATFLPWLLHASLAIAAGFAASFADNPLLPT